MIELVPLFEAVVDVAPSLAIGTGPAGPRSVGALTAAAITGDRVKASLAGPGAADFMVRTGAIGAIDVRMAIRTDDGALIYVTYGGRLDLSDPANGMIAYVAPLFETGDDRYAWLNAVQAVGKGRLVVLAEGAARLEYEIYQIR